MAAPDFQVLREAMVAEQLEARGIADRRILDAFRAVPRELFVAAELAHRAYGDHPLPIACGQTISQPYVVALMVEAAAIGPTDRVLEVGAGSGYAAAILAHLAKHVVAVERHIALAEEARRRLAALGLDNVTVVHGDGIGAGQRDGPFDAILVPASSPSIPDALIDQLAPDGRMVIPIGGDGSGQHLLKLTRSSDGRLGRKNLGAVRFVPLVPGVSA